MMRILRIAGENIASLAEPFEIRLDEGPIAAAGLFAITGETGAGKSSLLDSICLGLYGEYPRQNGAGVNDEVPDASGEKLKSRDSRSILRRGTAFGRAEVDFLGVDGETYRASWSVRRARGKANAKLQNVDRSLIRLSDDAVIANQITTVSERVKQLTGLSFEEFCRTSLLAQGDFAAFLTVGSQERAAILEKITGTGLYRAISQQVFERTTLAQEEVGKYRIREGEHQAMSDEDRQNLMQEISTAGQAQAERLPLLQRIQSGIDAYEREAAARELSQEAGERVQSAKTALDLTRGHAERISAFERVAPLRANRAECEAAEAALRQATDKIAAIEAKGAEAAQRVSEAQSVVSRVSEAHIRIEAAFKTYGPVWTEAERLDTLILAAQTQIGALSARLLTSTQALATAQGRRDQDQTSLSALEGSHADKVVRFNKVRNAEKLLSDWPRAEQQIQDRLRLLRRIDEANGAIETQKEAINNDLAKLDQLSGDIVRQAGVIAALEATIGDEAPAIAVLQELNPGEKRIALCAQISVWSRCVPLHKAYTEAVEAHTTAKSRLEELRAAVPQAMAQRDAAELDLKTATAAVEALEAPAVRAEASLSQEAARLRATLDDGHECPVCGSLDHPGHSDSALAELAEEIRRSVQSAKARRSDCATALTQSSAALSAAQSRAEDARSISERAEARVAQCLSSLIEALPEQVSQGELPSAQMLSDQLSELREAELEALAQEAELNRLAQAAALRAMELEKHREKLHRISEERRGIEAATGTHRDAISRLEQSIADARSTLSETDSAIDALLAPIAMKAASFTLSKPEDVTRVTRLMQSIQVLSAAISSDAEQIRRLQERIENADAVILERTPERDSAAQELESAESGLTEQMKRRAGLLDGAETGAHRTRINGMRIEIQKKKEAASASLSGALAEQAALGATLESAQEAVAQARERLDLAGRHQAEIIGKLHMDDASIRSALEVTAETVASLQKQLRAAQDEHVAATASLESRLSDHEKLKANLPPQTLSELRAEQETLNLAQQEGGQRIGMLHERLQSDDRARAALGDLRYALIEARGVEDTWLAVNEAVGSKTGGKFTMIAQSVTLRILVERANLYLRELKPRYQLAMGGSDLSLHVVDEDMGGEIRSTRSLSGGECFLVSLALALALSAMGGGDGIAGTLFIDEGFGSLDSESLEMAIDALETLQAQGRTIGVISHVAEMKDRIPVQIRVTKKGSGRSEVTVMAA